MLGGKGCDGQKSQLVSTVLDTSHTWKTLRKMARAGTAAPLKSPVSQALSPGSLSLASRLQQRGSRHQVHAEARKA